MDEFSFIAGLCVGLRLHIRTIFIMTHPRIEIRVDVMGGKPVIKGTRIPVELIVRKLSEGATEGDLRDGYPTLQPEDVRAALAYAADMLAHEMIVVQSA